MFFFLTTLKFDRLTTKLSVKLNVTSLTIMKTLRIKFFFFIFINNIK